MSTEHLSVTHIPAHVPSYCWAFNDRFFCLVVRDRDCTVSVLCFWYTFTHHYLYSFTNKKVFTFLQSAIVMKLVTKSAPFNKLFLVGPQGGVVSSRVAESYLWECKQLGAYSPIVLLNTLLFFCTKHFGYTTLEQHQRLSFTNFNHCSKPGSRTGKTNYLLHRRSTATPHRQETGADWAAKAFLYTKSSDFKVLKMLFLVLQNIWGNGRRQRSWNCIQTWPTLCSVLSDCTSFTSLDGEK